MRARCASATPSRWKTLFGIRDATQIDMFDRGRRTKVRPARPCGDPHGAECEGGPRRSAPSGYEPVCVGTTTSAPHGALHPPLMEREGVRIIIGKGGLREGSQDAFRDLGGAYLAVVGGAAALETTWIEAVEDVDLDDLNPESLYKFRIKGFGPLLVAMDSHGGSLYATVNAEAARRRQAVLEKLGAAE